MWQAIASTIGRIVPANPAAGIGSREPADIAELRADAAKLALAIADYDSRKAAESGDTVAVPDDYFQPPPIGDDQCFTGNGVVTELAEEHGILNHTLYFALNSLAAGLRRSDLQVGGTVSYLAHRLSEDIPVRIVRIVAVVTNDWEKPSAERCAELVEQLRDQRPLVFATSHRSMHGEVVGRRKQMVTVELDNGETEDVDLELVATNFVPQCGDLVVLDCKVQEDPSFGDMMGQVLEVQAMNAARSKCAEGEVTHLDDREGYGVVARMYAFYANALDSDYLRPQIGDRVAVDAIECSSRATYAWRCVKVVQLQGKGEGGGGGGGGGGGQKAGGGPKAVAATAAKEAVSPEGGDSAVRANKEGLVISSDLFFNFTRLGERARLSLEIHNTADRAHEIQCARFANQSIPSCNHQVRLVQPRQNDVSRLEPGQRIEYVFEATAKLYGHSTEHITFHFADKIRIRRQLNVQLIDPTGSIPSIGTGSNVYRNRAYTQSVWARRLDIIPGVKLNERVNFVAVQLGSWEVPQALRDVILINAAAFETDGHVQRLLPFFSAPLCFASYEQWMHNLLYMEEIQVYHNMRRYDRDRAHFRRENEYLALRVHNMADTRPALVLGDYVLAMNAWQEPSGAGAGDDGVKWPSGGSGGGRMQANRGDIHKILGDRVLLKFNENFHQRYNGEDWKLEFHYSRVPMRKCHYAVQKSIKKLGEDFLFPNRLIRNAVLQLDVELEGDEGRLMLRRPGASADAERTEVPWNNKQLNIVQKQAIVNVLRGEARPMPYVIFGPPGTGKTSTLIETILLLFQLLPDSRVLVATPSNSAANLITQRLVDSGCLKAGEFVRIIGHNAIAAGRIPDELLPYTATCNIAKEGTVKDEVITLETGMKVRCNASSLGRHRVTVGTCNTIGTMMQMEFARDHFTHAIVDEAGQCTEPETLIPVTFVSREFGQVVLAGDKQQLGPVVLSKQAIDRGLQLSLLARMMERYPYQIDKERFGSIGFDPRVCTKLLYCYRSLPSILSMFNQLFYGNELIATVCPTSSAESALLRKLDDILPGKGRRTEAYGMFFVGIRGQNLQDGESPSWFNAAEAKSILLFVLKLYRAGVSADDIGIITPYTKQVKVIRNMLTEHELSVPKIGTVEEFQGQERMIVLVSTVRSNPNLLHQDRHFHIGFVANTKRLNVTISRARALLMVFGNPHLLATDANWRFLIKAAVRNGTYDGCDCPEMLLQQLNVEEPTDLVSPGSSIFDCAVDTALLE